VRSGSDPFEEKMTVTESLPVVDAVRRELEIDEQVQEQRPRVRAVLTLTTNIALAPARLWPLLTRPDELARWFGPVTGDLREGGRFQALRGAEGRILRIEEPHQITLTWQQDGGEDPLQLRLDPEDDGSTALRLRHAALIDRETFTRVGPGQIAMRWEIALLALAALTDGWRATCLEPAPSPSPEWLHSAEGAAYVSAWSVRWAAQAVAAGVDEQTARRGELETARLVLGG
jgi:uncharacterized protein YndB with AHSA1/START domain